MERATDLKPCPFCGAPGRLRNGIGAAGNRRWWVDCSDDDCPAFVSDTKDEAIAAWNNRAKEVEDG